MAGLPDADTRLVDVTRALRESEARYRTLFDSLPAVAMRLGRGGVHLQVSAPTASAIGHPAEDLIGRTHRELGYPESLCTFWETTIQRVFDTEQPIDTEFAVDGPGGPRTYAWHLIPERDAEGRVVAVLSICPEVTAQRQVQRDYQNLLGRMFNGVATGEVVRDDGGHAVDLRFLSVNPAFERMTGLSSATVVGTTVRQLMPSIDARVVEALGRVAVDGQPVFLDNFRTPLGKRFEVSAFMPAPGQLACILSDITDRIRAEEALRRSEERWRSYVLSAPYGVFVTDRDGFYLEVNPAACAICGYSEAELIGMHLTDLIDPDALPAAREHFSKVVDAGHAYGGVVFRRKDDTRRSVSVWAVRLGEDRMLGFVADITEQQAAADQLEMTKQSYLDVLNSVSESIYVQDERGTFIDVNEGAARMYRCERRELIGQSPATVSAPGRNDLETLRKVSEEVARTGVPARFDFWGVRKDGEVFPKEVVINKGRYFNRDVLIATARDVSDRMRVEVERERLREQLLQSQKMESVGRLAGGVAHDFNNMLGLIIGHTEMALERVVPGHDLHADLVEVRRAAERSADLTRQLLAFARKQTVAPQVLDVNVTVGGLIKMLRRLIGEDIDLVWRPGPDVGTVLLDPSQLDQVLANLCLNARDAIDGTGTVAIDATAVEVDANTCARHEGVTPGLYVRIAVSDTGCGMEPDVIARLFEPFFTTKAVGKGTGLGLATVYGIVKQNNGFIEVTSEPGRGATFGIHLPRHVAPRAASVPAEGAAPRVRGNETILLVEDERAILDMIRRMLSRYGYTVLTASSPGAAIALARAHAGAIHLLITDVVMPEMNGRDLARNVLSLHPDVQRLFMSGYTADVIAHHGVLDEGVHFLQKPFTMSALADKIRQVLDH